MLGSFEFPNMLLFGLWVSVRVEIRARVRVSQFRVKARVTLTLKTSLLWDNLTANLLSERLGESSPIKRSEETATIQT